MADDVKLRTLRKNITSCRIDQAEDTPTINTAGGAGWRIVTHSTLPNLIVGVHESYFDLSGYLIQDETFFPSNVMVQGLDDVRFTITQTNIHMVWDIISQERLTDDQLALCASADSYPGSSVSAFLNPGGETDLRDIVYGRVRRWTVQGNLAGSGACIPFAENFFGLNDGTAASKLWCYRIIANLNDMSTGFVFTTSPVTYVVAGAVAAEPDLEYIMRLKRSYELSPPFS